MHRLLLISIVVATFISAQLIELRARASCEGPRSHTLFVPVADALDTTSPLAPVVTVLGANGGTPTTGPGCSCDTCGTPGEATLLLHVARESDLGFTLELADGDLPPGASEITTPVEPDEGQILHFHWFEGPAHFSLDVRAVDRAGNVSPPTRVDIDVD